MELEIRQKIVSTLTGIFFVQKHFDRLPDQVVPDRYIVFWIVSNVSSRDTIRRYEEYNIQFDVFDKSVSPVAVESIGNTIYTLMDKANFVLTNWWTLDIHSLNRPRVISADENYWQAIVEVKMKFEHK